MASRLNLWLPCQPRILLQAGEVPSFPGDTHALCGLPGPTRFVPIQVPFRGGCKGWSSDQGSTDEERFLVRHDVRFTDTLVELVNTEDWTDMYHFTSHATTRVLRHALERVQEVLDPLKDSISVRHPVIVCVLSDGWTRLHTDKKKTII